MTNPSELLPRKPTSVKRANLAIPILMAPLAGSMLPIATPKHRIGRRLDP